MQSCGDAPSSGAGTMGLTYDRHRSKADFIVVQSRNTFQASPEEACASPGRISVVTSVHHPRHPSLQLQAKYSTDPCEVRVRNMSFSCLSLRSMIVMRSTCDWGALTGICNRWWTRARNQWVQLLVTSSGAHFDGCHVGGCNVVH